MFRLKPITALSLATALVGGVLTSPASAGWEDDSHPVLLTEQTAAVTAGGSVWLNIMWASAGDVEDFEVTFKANHDGEVEYSQTTVDHAGPMNGYQMLDNEADFTAVRLTVPEDTKHDEVQLEAKATWTADDGKSEKHTFKITVPVVQYTGEDWQLVGNTSSAVNGWVEMKVTGFAPSTEDLEFEVMDDAGTEPYLPQVTWTGPHNDGQLVTGETDMVRFYVEPGSVTPGDHTVTFTTAWIRNGEPKTKNVDYTFTIN